MHPTMVSASLMGHGAALYGTAGWGERPGRALQSTTLYHYSPYTIIHPTPFTPALSPSPFNWTACWPTTAAWGDVATLP